ncbi:hypothetical protein [Microcoleus sp. B9-D4]|uniref:hypothetical protein n=1 Tax=Microcoleus sp. B9-D4 TaxID=2818711 RepID=UPI002FCFEBBF
MGGKQRLHNEKTHLHLMFGQAPSGWPWIMQVLHEWVKKPAVHSSKCAIALTEMADLLKLLECENRGLRNAYEVLLKASEYLGHA